MKTAVETIFAGKDRSTTAVSRRCAATTWSSRWLHAGLGLGKGAGGEPGRPGARALLAPRIRVKSYEELNAWLLDQCIAHAKAHRHPEFKDQTVWQVFEAERPSLAPIPDGSTDFMPCRPCVSKTCLVRFDNNRYSVAASAIGRPVEIRAYAERIEIRQDGRWSASIPARSDATGRSDPWHAVPVRPQTRGAAQRRTVQELGPADRA